MSEYLYRYDTIITDIYDGPRCFKIHCQEYEIFKRTGKGVWILTTPIGRYYVESGKEVPKKHKKFILNWYKGARRRWAYPTKELAYNSYCIRKHRQLQYLENQIKNCEFVNKMIAEEREIGRMLINRVSLKLAEDY